MQQQLLCGGERQPQLCRWVGDAAGILLLVFAVVTVFFIWVIFWLIFCVVFPCAFLVFRVIAVLGFNLIYLY